MSVILAMCLFSLSMSITPGPVNLVTLSTGLNYGFKKTIPFVSGATIGFTLLLLAVGSGLYHLVETAPIFIDLLGYGGTGFICYMGYKIATAKSKVEVNSVELPSFVNGFVLQWLNPKAWIACLSGVSAFNLVESQSMLLIFCSLYFAICYLSIGSWALLGDKIGPLINNRKVLLVFNAVMGGALVFVGLYLLYMQHCPSMI